MKYDGFRALSFLDGTSARPMSRNGNRFGSFEDLVNSLSVWTRVKSAVLDGEIACLDGRGHSQFNELLFYRGVARFRAFDLLSLNGVDLRDLFAVGK